MKLDDFKKANIDWQQAKGAKLNMAILQSAPWSTYNKKATSIFKELTGIDIALNDLPELELNDKTFADLVAGANTFDLFHMDFMFAPQYSQSKFIEPLDKYLNDSNVTDKAWLDVADFFPGVWSTCQNNGETWAIPAISQSSLLFYRKDLFDKAPDTFDDLWNQAKKVKSDSIAGFCTRAQRGQGMNVFMWTSFLRGFGGNFFVDYPSDMHPAINSAEAIEAAKFYADLLTLYGPPGVANYTWAENFLACQQNKTASIIEASGAANLVDNRELSQTYGKWAFAQVPQGKGGRHPAVFSWCATMNAKSKNKTAAWLYLQFVASKPYQMYTRITDPNSIRASGGEDPAYKAILKDQMADPEGWLKANNEALSTAKADYRPRFPNWREVGDRVGIALQSVVAGEQEAKAAMDAAQKDIEGIMKKNKYIS